MNFITPNEILIQLVAKIEKERIAQHIERFTVKILCNDGLEKIVDLQEYINSKKHPFFKPLQQVEEFKKFQVHKTLVWNSGADIAPEYLRNQV